MMKPCFGLSNLTGTIIIGMIQVVLCSILCLAYGMALFFLNLGRDEMVKELDSEAGKDFVASLGLANPYNSEKTVFVTIALYTFLYSFKVVLAIQLLLAVRFDSVEGVRFWLSLEVVTFMTRIVLFITSLSLLTFASGTSLIYIFSYFLEIYCIWIVFLLVLDMTKPSWKTKVSEYPEGLRMHSSRYSRRTI